MGLIKTALIVFFLFLIGLLPAFSQAVPMSSEIFRLEQPFTGTENERFQRYMDLSMIYYLSGNVELALGACQNALIVFPNDVKALFQQVRYLVALGEYERATVVVNRLMRMNLAGSQLMELRILEAKLNSFQHSDFRSLSALADDADFSAHRSAVYYTLWTLQGNNTYRNRLNMEFRNSPEARIASGRSVNAAPTPLWLLFPGRQSIVLEPFTERPPVRPHIHAPAAISGPQLQAGLFGREDNASSLAERIRRAGFEANLQQRLVNGNNFWVVLVPAGSDSNATIRRLRAAGFDSFPIIN